MPQVISTILDVLLVLVGFGAIIFVHELGHFLAARWAGIRVMAFAIGFGPALLTFRKGIGLRARSSEGEYLAALHRASDAAKARGEPVPVSPMGPKGEAISPTEYRLNALPFGGYVKMLGQEDINPNTTSEAPDSYQRCVPWKKLVVISAGVVMNIILAAVLFVVVFTAGRKVDPATIGVVESGGAAALATPQGAWSHLGQGLRAGDVIEGIDGEKPLSFDDVRLAAAMAKRNSVLTFDVRRPGVDGVARFDVVPQENQFSGMQDIGATPAFGNLLEAGLADGSLRTGMTLTHVDGEGVASAHDLDRAIHASQGRTLMATFRTPQGESVERQVVAVPELMMGFVGEFSRRSSGTLRPIAHLAGLTGVLCVQDRPDALDEHAQQQGLRPGDIFARVGSLEYPSMAEGVPYIRAQKGKVVPMVVLRQDQAGEWTQTDLSVRVRRDGRVGMTIAETSDRFALLAAPVPEVIGVTGKAAGQATRTSAAELPLGPGVVVVAVDGMPVRTLLDVASKVREAFDASDRNHVSLTIRRPQRGLPGLEGTGTGAGGETPPTETIEWVLLADEVRAIRELGWQGDVSLGLFAPASTLLKADGVFHALALGLHETKRTMLQTYLTFARLAQGTVKVEHLKGPVGITHLGTLIAERGFIWLLFFLALISVNLAVINFLPLPIVDGGQALFIIYEWIRGRPVPIPVQNVVTIAGLILIGGMFLFVTYNDIRNLLGV